MSTTMMMTRRNNKNVECVDEDDNVKYEVNDNIKNDRNDDEVNDSNNSDNYGKITTTDRVTDKKNCDDSII